MVLSMAALKFDVLPKSHDELTTFVGRNLTGQLLNTKDGKSSTEVFTLFLFQL
jgi:hypothetical protein